LAEVHRVTPDAVATLTFVCGGIGAQSRLVCHH
jgi:hypothetical protein